MYKWLEAVGYHAPSGPDPDRCSGGRRRRSAWSRRRRRRTATWTPTTRSSRPTAAGSTSRWARAVLRGPPHPGGGRLPALRRATTACSTVARRFVEHILDASSARASRDGTPGHPEIEMALVELYRETGDAATWTWRSSSSTSRGHGLLGAEARFGGAGLLPGPRPGARGERGRRPRRPRAVPDRGHRGRVPRDRRAGAARGAASQWDDMVGRKLYLTGGVGVAPPGRGLRPAVRAAERPRLRRDLRRDRQHLWSWRMLLATGQAPIRRPDRAHPVSTASSRGVSLDGARYFYVNPLPAPGAPRCSAAAAMSGSGTPSRAARRTSCALLATLGQYVAPRDATGCRFTSTRRRRSPPMVCSCA